MQIQDPRLLPQDDLPLFVFSDNATDLIAFLITWRTKGTWNHAMLAVNQGKFVAQALTYSEFPMDVYMKRGSRLEFFTLVNKNKDVVNACQGYVSKRLAQPWWKKAYDWIGIFGQAIGLPKIHTPGLEYCSVDVTHCLKSIAHCLPSQDSVAILAIPDEINPQDLHDYMIRHPDVFKLYGDYEADEGVLA